MQRFKRLHVDFFLVLLILIAGILCFQNYTPHTILSGWDTIHPEFNFSQYLTRITSMWQEQQGLGAPPSQAHASEIPRMIIYSVLMLLFPFDFVRYSYIFLMLIMGPVGVYLFLRYLFYKEHVKPEIAKTSAFLGGLFYLLNLGSMQHFIVILEMFATKFGFLGFLYLFATKFLDTGKRRDFIILLIFVFFASSMAHTATLWYIFYLGLVLYVGSYILLHKEHRKVLLNRGLWMLLSILAINLYWILPNVYYSMNYGSDVITAKINRLFSEEAYLNNKAYGDIADLLIFRNFLFNWKVMELTRVVTSSYPIISSVDLMQSWKLYLQNTGILMIGYFLSSVALIGSVLSLKKKNPYLISLLPITLIAITFLLSDVPIFAQLFDFLRAQSDFFKETLRFPFTKLSLYLIFSFAIFFAYTHLIVLNKLTKKFTEYRLRVATEFYLCFFAGLIILYSWPAFTGNYISHILRVQIPKEYYDLFRWSQNAKQGRMLELPIQSLYGWVVYGWDNPTGGALYQGAGFTWFGLKQPLLNREFDRWYPYNEQNYRELSYALYSQDTVLFEQLLYKYNIRYLLVDENTANPGTQDASKQLFYAGIEQLLPKIHTLHLAKQFGTKLKVYEFTPSQTLDSMFVLNKPRNVSPIYRWGYVDQAYSDNADYVSGKDLSSDVFAKVLYPTRNILNTKERINTDTLTLNTITYKLSLPEQQEAISVPNLLNTEKEIFTDIYLKKENNKMFVLLDYLLPHGSNETDATQEFELPSGTVIFSINSKVVILSQKLSSVPLYVGETVLTTQESNTIKLYRTDKAVEIPFNLTKFYPFACSEQKANQIYSGSVIQNNGFTIEAKNVKICADMQFSEVFDTYSFRKNGLLNVGLTYTIPKNTDNEFCLYNKASDSCSQNIFFPSFIDTQKEINQQFPITARDVNNLFFRFILDVQDSKDLKIMTVSNITTTFYEESGTFSFIPQLSNYNQINKQQSSLIGNLPRKQIDISAGHMTKDIKDCGLNPAKSLDKSVKDGLVEYKSVQGILCDVYSLDDLSQQSGYILALESKNIQGLPLRVCLQDDLTKKCFIEDELSNNKDFKSDYFLLPPYNKQGGYHLVLTNISIGDLPSDNQLRGISIIPFPYSYFQAFQSSNVKEKKEEAQRETISFFKYSPYYYSMPFTAATLTTDKVIVLDQAYEKNWKAYIAPSWVVRNPLLRMFVPVFGHELSEHVLVNNWENGWVVDVYGVNKNNESIAFIFLPQWLIYLGFLIFPIPLIAHFLRKKK